MVKLAKIKREEGWVYVIRFTNIWRFGKHSQRKVPDGDEKFLLATSYQHVKYMLKLFLFLFKKIIEVLDIYCHQHCNISVKIFV